MEKGFPPNRKYGWPFPNAQVKIREEQLDGGNIVLYIIKEFLKAEKCLSHPIALERQMR